MSGKGPLHGRRVAITGGGRGIGVATARELHARGAEVAIGDLDHDVAKHAAASIAPEVVALGLDVSDRDSFAQFLEDSKARLGGLDVLINNAGIMPIGPFHSKASVPVRVNNGAQKLGRARGGRWT